ncbi:protein FAM72A-like isoform X1 [Limulus polyphemus]|uniref:Protein FAM72A-like isoform X1 n=1 Tax=Limulus polyphemus TaxID=6850 RepID=A0ABM1BS49_LIMPO|nr:protein FAM72A-like isoform X1 [Limulus polyphemus]
MSPNYNKKDGSSFGSKPVYILECCECDFRLCFRGMKAILLADTRIELYSTDLPPSDLVGPAGDCYSTGKCQCQIQNIACSSCGNLVGYHVIQPCSDCLSDCNNGHLWMFHTSAIKPHMRLNSKGTDYLLWQDMENDGAKSVIYEEQEESCER